MPRPAARKYTHDGRTMTLNEWAGHAGVPYSTIVSRLKMLKWTFAEAVTGRRDPRKHLKRVMATRVRFKGRDRTIAEWGEEYGIKPNLIRQRLAYGWTPAEAITGLKRGGKPRKKAELQLTFRGVTKGVSEWAAERGICSSRIRGRLKIGWTVAEAITGEKQDKWKARRHGVQSG